MSARSIRLRGQAVGDGRFPLVCAPLIARDVDALLAETAVISALGPDLLEWRIDHFQGIGNTDDVVALTQRIKQTAGSLPLIFTRRHAREGGEKIDLSEPEVVSLYGAVCESGVDWIDFEMSNDAGHVRELRHCSSANGVDLILSFHDFQATPPLEVLLQRFHQAEQLGADVAKVAVMPRNMQDVLVLLTATLQASQQLSIPVVSMAMGAEGALTRLCGWAFGSAMTFGVGQGISAPGQLPLEELRAGLALLQKAAGRSLLRS